MDDGQKISGYDSVMTALVNTQLGATPSQHCYDILSLPLSSETPSSPDEIKAAYHKMARNSHPDKQRTNSGYNEFVTLKEAYDILKDPDKKRAYDTALNRKLNIDNAGASWVQAKCEGSRAAAVSEIVTLSDMTREAAVAGEGGDGEGDDRLINVYLKQCRCGDEYELYEEDIKGCGGSEIILECHSCNLTLLVRLATDDLKQPRA